MASSRIALLWGRFGDVPPVGLINVVVVILAHLSIPLLLLDHFSVDLFLEASLHPLDQVLVEPIHFIIDYRHQL